MITEDYVSFEIAKLLKEKGFDWEDSPFCSEQDKDEWNQNNNYTIPNPNYDATIPFDSEALTLVVPHVSHQTAMKWLREVHKTSIEITSTGYLIDNDAEWECDIKAGRRLYFKYITNEKSFESCANKAIKYCLENLI